MLFFSLYPQAPRRLFFLPSHLFPFSSVLSSFFSVFFLPSSFFLSPSASAFLLFYIPSPFLLYPCPNGQARSRTIDAIGDVKAKVASILDALILVFAQPNDPPRTNNRPNDIQNVTDTNSIRIQHAGEIANLAPGVSSVGDYSFLFCYTSPPPPLTEKRSRPKPNPSQLLRMPRKKWVDFPFFRTPDPPNFRSPTPNPHIAG